MAFIFEADINDDVTPEQVNRFAMEHGCNSVLLKESGSIGDNPVYKFTSTSYDCIEELALQIFNDNCEFVSDIINEV